jgi:hypothetical protein
MAQWIVAQNEEALLETSYIHIQKSADGREYLVMAVPIRTGMTYVHDICIRSFKTLQEAKQYLIDLSRQFRRD